MDPSLPPSEPEPTAQPAAPLPDASARQAAAPRPNGRAARALLEVFLCSGVPTQLLVGQVLMQSGWPPFTPDGTPQLGPLLALGLIDTCVVLAIIAALLRAGGERGWPLVRGGRSIVRETGLGVALTPLLLFGVGLSVLAVRRVLPWAHNVPQNPFEGFMKTPASAGLFAIVAVVAGGLREVVQRMFMLHRFEQHLGGALFGLFVLSVAFGAGHVMQGWDAAIVTGLLGLAWGWLYLRRRSAVAPIVSHAGYNLAQILVATFTLPGLRA